MIDNRAFGEVPENLPELVFMDIVRTVGPKTMKLVFNIADDTDTHGPEGITSSSEDTSYTISLNDENISFRLNKFGPFILPMFRARELVKQTKRSQLS